MHALPYSPDLVFPQLVTEIQTSSELFTAEPDTPSPTTMSKPTQLASENTPSASQTGLRDWIWKLLPPTVISLLILLFPKLIHYMYRHCRRNTEHADQRRTEVSTHERRNQEGTLRMDGNSERCNINWTVVLLLIFLSVLVILLCFLLPEKAGLCIMYSVRSYTYQSLLFQLRWFKL